MYFLGKSFVCCQTVENWLMLRILFLSGKIKCLFSSCFSIKIELCSFIISIEEKSFKLKN